MFETFLIPIPCKAEHEFAGTGRRAGPLQ